MVMKNNKETTNTTQLRIHIDPTWIKLTEWKSKLTKKMGSIYSYSDVIDEALNALEETAEEG